PHGLAAGMLEHDAGVLPDQAADVLAQAAPLALVLGVLIAPEAVAGRLAVDHRLAAEVLQQLDLLGRAHHADGDPPAVEHVLHRVAAQPSRRSPHQHGVTLLHAGAVAPHQHAIGGGVAQGVARRLLPAQVGGLGHDLVGLHHGEVGQAAEVGLETPDALVGSQHGVVVGRGVLVVDVVAVDDDPVAGLPVANGRAHADDNARGVRTDHVVGQVV